MRSYIFVILSGFVFAALFLLYWIMQPAGVKPTQATDRTNVIPDKPDPGGMTKGIGPGENVWVKQYDSKGVLASRFSGDQYIPQPDGTIKVTKPVAQFFLANHQHLEVHGTEGNVVMKDVPDLAHSAFANMGPQSPPSRGRLDNVVVTLVDESDPKNTVVPLTMTTKNVVFDNETFRISTEGYTEGGQAIADDQVPVHITGQIRMEGRGLMIRWNDRDGRLELLEVAHGDVLIIDDPSNLSFGGQKKPKDKRQPVAFRMPNPLPDMLAANDPNAAQEIITRYPGPATRPQGDGLTHAPHGSTAPVIYLATFYDNVRINQPDPSGHGDQMLIDHADRMDVDFLLKQSNPPGAATQTAPDNKPATPAQAPTTTPASQPSAEVPQTQPTSQPVAQKEPPVYVHWTGVLRITPLKAAPPVPLKPGDSAVTITGAPVLIHRVDPKQQGIDDVRSATVLYQTAGEKVSFGTSDQVAQILIDKFPPASAKDQSVTHLVSNGTVQYARDDQKAVITGVGNADVPLEPEERNKHPVLHAAWTKRAEFDFTQPAEGKQANIQSGRFEGDVDIRHPHLVLRSQLLDLMFGPPIKVPTTRPADAKTQSQPNLKQVIATTGVYCQLEGSDAKKQMIECNRLALDTDQSNGKLYARHVNATGTVHAYGQDDLRAGYVDLLLYPSRKPKAATTKPAKGDLDAGQMELEQMIARDNVIARSKEGSIATGDELRVTTEDGKQHTVLTSAAGASVTDAKGNIVRGPKIQFDPDSGKAHVVGPGSMHAIQQVSATQPAQPVDVTWAGGADFDGAANRVDVRDHVEARSVDKKGFIDTASGDHIRIDLRKKPATQPAATEPVEVDDDERPKKPADDSGGMKMDLFKGKEVVAMTIEDRAVVGSTLYDTSGGVLQQFQLSGETIIVREIADDGTPSRSISVPVPGKMLVRDHRTDEKPAQAEKEAGPAGARGATAFEWQKQMLYSEATQRADMTGNVAIAHQDDNPAQPPAHISAEHVIAWFEKSARPPAGPATTKPDQQQQALQLRYLRAEGSTVTVTRDADQLTARQVDYDPKRRVLIATGTDRNPVVFVAAGNAQTTADQVEWDTVTWNPKFKNAIIDYRPPTPPAPTPPKKKDKPAPRSTP